MAKRPRSGEPVEREGLRIFLSHKLKDAEAAIKLKQLLSTPGPTLDIFVAADKRAGRQWEPQVEEALAKAHWLVLLYTREDDEWDWCLYESGFFSGKHYDAKTAALGLKHRLICLHSDQITPPNPFRSWDSLPATEEDITKWLREIYTGNGEFLAVNEGFVNGDPPNPAFPALVRDMTSLLRAPEQEPDSDDFFRRFEIELTKAQMADLKKDRMMPKDVTVLVPRDTMEDIFSAASYGDPERMTWVDFVGRIGPLRNWANSIPACIARLNTVRMESPFLPLLRSVQGDQTRLYRPVIARRLRIRDVWTRFEIALASTPDTVQVEASADVDKLTHLLLLARTFRWGILDPGIREAERAAAGNYSGDRAELVARVIADLEFAVIESANRGVEVEQDITSLFPPDVRQFYMENVWTPWAQIYPQIRGCFDTCRECQLGDQEKARQIMSQLRSLLLQVRDLNGLFITLAANRLLELADGPNILGTSEAAQELRKFIRRGSSPVSKARTRSKRIVSPPTAPELNLAKPRRLKRT